MTEDDGVTFRQYSYDNLNQLKTELFYDKVSGVGEYKWYSVSSSGNVAFIAFNYNNGTYTTSYSSGQGYGSGTDWKKLMTSFGGTPITYDANGNPLSYSNGQSYTFTWQKGRQLASAVTGTNTINYGYDAGGQRISKTVNGTTHTYTYDGSLLLCDKWGSQYIEYFYDATGKPYAIRYYDGILPTKYYFTKNIEGDILELRSSANTLVARYIYDGWGKLLEVRDASGNAITSSTHIANLNSLRYRGYFYDTETKLYYLQSRYYDPQAQRFISPDVYISTGQGIIGYNMFAYCNNNPVNMIDLFGCDAIWIQEKNSAKGQGHSGLIVQNENGDWWYFYWGPKTETLLAISPFGVKANPQFIFLADKFVNLHSIEDVRLAISNNKKVLSIGETRLTNLSSIMYFSGDYTKTWNFCDKLQQTNEKYNLYINNCFQKSVQAMAQSNYLFNGVKGTRPNASLYKIEKVWKQSKRVASGGRGGYGFVVMMVK